MAYNVGDYVQSDELFLIKTTDGKIIGYSSEFDMCTGDIAEACGEETHHLANWFGDDGSDWIPATLDDAKAAGLEHYLIGSKSDMKMKTPLEPV